MRMAQKLSNELSTFVQVMAWCPQATSQYLGQCWPRSMWPYGVSKQVRPRWFNRYTTLQIYICRIFCNIFLWYIVLIPCSIVHIYQGQKIISDTRQCPNHWYCQRWLVRPSAPEILMTQEGPLVAYPYFASGSHQPLPGHHIHDIYGTARLQRSTWSPTVS